MYSVINLLLGSLLIPLYLVLSSSYKVLFSLYSVLTLLYLMLSSLYSVPTLFGVFFIITGANAIIFGALFLILDAKAIIFDASLFGDYFLIFDTCLLHYIWYFLRYDRNQSSKGAVQFGGSLGKAENPRLQFSTFPLFTQKWRRSQSLWQLYNLKQHNLGNLVEVFQKEKITPAIVSLWSVREIDQLGINNGGDMVRLNRKERVRSGAPTFDISKSVLENHLEEGFMIEEIASYVACVEKFNFS